MDEPKSTGNFREKNRIRKFSATELRQIESTSKILDESNRELDELRVEGKERGRSLIISSWSSRESRLTLATLRSPELFNLLQVYRV